MSAGLDQSSRDDGSGNMTGILSAEDAIHSLLVSLGDEHRSRIERSKFLDLCEKLGIDAKEEGEVYWKELLEFCNAGDNDKNKTKNKNKKTADFIDADDLWNLYRSQEYVADMASVNLLARLKEIFALMDRSGDGAISLQEFLHGDWKQEFLKYLANNDSDNENKTNDETKLEGTSSEASSLLELDDETLTAVFQSADLDGNGELDFVEFCAAVLKIDDNTIAFVKPFMASRAAAVKKATIQEKVFIGSSMKDKQDALKMGVAHILNDAEFGQRWLTGLFEAYPETRALFNNNIKANVKPVMDMLLKVIDSLDHFEQILPRLQRLGVKHVQMGIKFEYFEHLLYAMLDAFDFKLETKERQTWVDLFALIYYTFMSAEDYPALMANEALKVGSLVEGDLENPMLDPSCSNNQEFVIYVKQLALNHLAVTHNYLLRLSNGDLPDMDTALCLFLDEYQHYGKKFLPFMHTLLDDTTDDRHRELLQEDLASEQGKLDQDNIQLLHDLGIDPATIDGVPHTKLFQNMRNSVFQACGKDPDSIMSKENGAGKMFADEISDILQHCTYPARAAALGIGTECIVPIIYKHLIQAMKQNKQLKPSDYVFLTLHVQTDSKHGDTMESIVADLATTAESRAQMLQAVQAVLDTRCRLWDRLLSQTLKAHLDQSERSITKAREQDKNNDNTDKDMAMGTEDVSADPETLYDGTSQSWARSKPNCLSDFTARPVVFEMCRPHIANNTWVLDIGCGEGYCTRSIHDMGPEKVIGIDLSNEMIKLAKQSQANHEDGMHYIHGNATETITLLKKHFLDFGLTRQADLEGMFGLATAVFLFNYMPIRDMNMVIQQTYALLKPGGRFIFTVPHPALKYWHRSSKAPFYLDKEGSEGYFKDRDKRARGVIFTKDGKELNIQSMHKTLSDYMNSIRNLGFVIEEVKELGVDDKMMADDPDFFSGVEGIPLHVAFKVIKPVETVKRWLAATTSATTAGAATKNTTRGKEDQQKHRRVEESGLLKDTSAFTDAAEEFLVPPKEVLWNCMDYGESFVLKMPQLVVEELVRSAKSCMERGIDHTNYNPGDIWPLTNVKRFGQECANRLMRRHGNLIVQGLDIDSLADNERDREALAKLCYYILMTCTGNINTTRGRLFDVKNRNLDAKKDNVLFSATSQECGWHSDGSSRDWFPDMVCLLCIRPAQEGGEFQIANACNAFYDIRTRIPEFLMYELVRPIARDIIEKGASSGFGANIVKSNPSSFWTSLSRQPQILRHRVRLNCYPIFERNELTRQSKFRYLDHWLLSGHAKAGFRVSPLLKMATKELEKALHRLCRFDRCLKRGEIAMANNHLVAHRRNAFYDPPELGEDGRLLVRCWMKVFSEEK